MGGECTTSHLVPLSAWIDMTKQTIWDCSNLHIELKKMTKPTQLGL